MAVTHLQFVNAVRHNNCTMICFTFDWGVLGFASEAADLSFQEFLIHSIHLRAESTRRLTGNRNDVGDKYLKLIGCGPLYRLVRASQFEPSFVVVSVLVGGGGSHGAGDIGKAPVWPRTWKSRIRRVSVTWNNETWMSTCN